MDIYTELFRLRAQIQTLEFRLIRLRTGRKAIEQYTVEKADYIVERLVELRTHGQRLVAKLQLAGR